MQNPAISGVDTSIVMSTEKRTVSVPIDEM